MLNHTNLSFFLSVAVVLGLCFSASGEVTVDPVGFSVFIEQEDTLIAPITLMNSGEENVGFRARFLNVDREEELRIGPRRDDPGDLLNEVELDHHYTLGFSYDHENDIMWATHTIDARIAGYQFDGNEITETVADFATAANPVSCGYLNGSIYCSNWQTGILQEYNSDGELLNSINLGVTGIMGCTADAETGLIYVLDFPSVNVTVYDVENDYDLVGTIAGILGQEDIDFRGRLNWVPEHDDGHLWVSYMFSAWQVAVDEEWEWEIIQEIDLGDIVDVRSYAIGHDGTDLWASSVSEFDPDFHTAYIIDDGINEPNWLTFDPEDGEIPGGEELVIDAVILPVELEDGVYEILVQFRLDDPGQPSIEMSLIMALEIQTANVAGIVFNAADDDPVENARIDMDYYVMSRFSDDEGTFSFDDLPPGEYVLTITAEDFLPSTAEVSIEDGGEDIDLEIGLLHAEFVPSVQEIIRNIAIDDEMVVEFEVTNEGNGPLTYSTEKRLEGGADAEPWTLRESILVGQEVDDSRIEGVVFIDDLFYVSGSNDRHPTMYIFNREGALVDTFAQPTDGDNSMKGLASDGRLIWGADQSTVYGFTTDGEVEYSFESPFRPVSAIEWDPDRGWLWMCATTTNIVALDLNGDQQAEIDREELRIYGLAYWRDDPDGCPLYVFHKDRDNDLQTVHKVNPVGEEDLQFVIYLEPELGGSPAGAFITNTYDIYSWVFMDIVNAPGNLGGDRIDIWQLDARLDWFELDPTDGVIQAEQTQVFTVNLNSNDMVPEMYSGMFVFDHDGIGGESIISVVLNVTEQPVQAERILQLDMGWNMVSANLQPNERDVVELTRGLVDDGILLMMKNGWGNFYSPQDDFNNIPGWFVEEGYLMKVARDTEFLLTGLTVMATDTIVLDDGWQMISYYPRVAVDAIAALSAIRDQLIIAKDGDGNFYIVEWDFSNMGDMREGQGYLLKMSEPADLVYQLRDINEDEVARLPQQGRSVYRQPGALPVHEPTGINMSLLIVGDAVSGLEAAVYAGDIFAGSGVFSNGACGISVWGDDPSTAALDGAAEGDELEVRFYQDGVELTNVESTWKQGIPVYKTDDFAIMSVDLGASVPESFELGEPYPNPFNSSVVANYNLPVNSLVNIVIYDIFGREVITLKDEQITAGHHAIAWQGENQAGLTVPSGVYILKIKAGDFNAAKKMMLVR